jgi:hypothetical protein
MSSAASVAFATLFVGMVTGVQPVAVNVAGGVEEVRLLLDGREVARILSPPWRTAIDLGHELAPRKLTAVGLDDLGEEVARADQHLNLPRSSAELQIHVERDSSGQARAAQLAWGGLQAEKPSALRAALDGKPLPVEPSGEIVLPAGGSGRGTLLTAEIEFPGGARSSAAAVLGVPQDEKAAGQLTAIPVRLKSRASVAERFLLAGGRPAKVVAVEEGPGEVVVVRPLSREAARAAVGARQPLQKELGLRETRLRVVWPFAHASSASYPGMSSDAILFEVSDATEPGEGGLYWLLTSPKHPLEAVNPPLRWADAVAMAGQAAYACGCRRAVLLVLSNDSPDWGKNPPERVENYLEKLRVPLKVWSLEKPLPFAAKGWSAVENASTVSAMRAAYRKLEKELESQSIVWIEGDWMPQEISLAPGAEGIELVR